MSLCYPRTRTACLDTLSSHPPLSIGQSPGVRARACGALKYDLIINPANSRAGGLACLDWILFVLFIYFSVRADLVPPAPELGRHSFAPDGIPKPSDGAHDSSSYESLTTRRASPSQRCHRPAPPSMESSLFPLPTSPHLLLAFSFLGDATCKCGKGGLFFSGPCVFCWLICSSTCLFWSGVCSAFSFYAFVFVSDKSTLNHHGRKVFQEN